jgi:hypothetical protein
MKNELKIQTKKRSKPPQPGTPSPARSVPSIEVEEVLEHISSPYRWELIDIPLVKKKLLVPKK